MTIWAFKREKTDAVLAHLHSLGFEAERVPATSTWDWIMTDAPRDILDKGLPLEDNDNDGKEKETGKETGESK